MKRSRILLTLCTTLAACRAPVSDVIGAESITARACDYSDTSFFANTRLSDREDWYARQLKAAGERPLCSGLTAADEVYRLNWIPSFHATVIVRVEHRAAETLLVAKRLSGAGGYEPGGVQDSATVPLSHDDWRAFNSLLNGVAYWQASSVPIYAGVGVDGAQWVLEGTRNGTYRVIDRWTPRRDGFDGRFRRLAEWMLAKSRLVADSLVREY